MRLSETNSKEWLPLKLLFVVSFSKISGKENLVEEEGRTLWPGRSRKFCFPRSVKVELFLVGFFFVVVFA